MDIITDKRTVALLNKRLGLDRLDNGDTSQVLQIGSGGEPVWGSVPSHTHSGYAASTHTHSVSSLAVDNNGEVGKYLQVQSVGGTKKIIYADAPSGGGATSVSWNDIQNKPASFNPSSHNHPASDIKNETLSPSVLPYIPFEKLPTGDSNQQVAIGNHSHNVSSLAVDNNAAVGKYLQVQSVGGTKKIIYADAPSGGGLNVEITSPSQGQMLRYNGNTWENFSPIVGNREVYIYPESEGGFVEISHNTGCETIYIIPENATIPAKIKAPQPQQQNVGDIIRIILKQNRYVYLLAENVNLLVPYDWSVGINGGQDISYMIGPMYYEVMLIAAYVNNTVKWNVI